MLSTKSCQVATCTEGSPSGSVSISERHAANGELSSRHLYRWFLSRAALVESGHYFQKTRTSVALRNEKSFSVRQQSSTCAALYDRHGSPVLKSCRDVGARFTVSRMPTSTCLKGSSDFLSTCATDADIYSRFA